MQLSNTTKMVLEFNRKIREKFGERVDDFCISDVSDDGNQRTFSDEFKAYDYFPVRITYEKGRFGCSIVYGDKLISLQNSQQWWDEADFDLFFKELQTELELRIPDKFLEAHGWL